MGGLWWCGSSEGCGYVWQMWPQKRECTLQLVSCSEKPQRQTIRIHTYHFLIPAQCSSVWFLTATQFATQYHSYIYRSFWIFWKTQRCLATLNSCTPLLTQENLSKTANKTVQVFFPQVVTHVRWPSDLVVCIFIDYNKVRLRKGESSREYFDQTWSDCILG